MTTVSVNPAIGRANGDRCPGTAKTGGWSRPRPTARFCLSLLPVRPRVGGAVRPGLGQVRLGGRLTGSGEGERRVVAGAFAVPVVDVDRHHLTRTDLLEEDL